MERQQLYLMIKLVIVDSLDVSPCHATTLTCREVLDGMETEIREVGNGSDHLSMIGGSERMGGIRNDRNSSDCLLHAV